MKRWTDDASAQRHYPQPSKLVAITGSSAVGTDNARYFIVPIVDARLRVKISVGFLMAPGSAAEVNLTGFANLWLAEADDDPIGETGGRILPLVNLAGSSEASPLAIPPASPLFGYSREFESAADYIQGKFTLLANITLGSWWLWTRYQPSPGQRFCPEEWNQIITQATPRVLPSDPIKLT